MLHEDRETRVHSTLSGHRIEYRPTPEVAAFLDRFAAMVSDPAVTEDDLVAVGYSKENPILDHTLFPDHPRGWVTKAVLEEPAYRVLCDLIFRKGVRERRIDVERIGAQYTMTVAEAAAALEVEEHEVRRAIAQRRLATWVHADGERLDPRALASIRR